MSKPSILKYCTLLVLSTVFLSRIAVADGELVWAGSFGSTGNDGLGSVIPDCSGNTYLAGGWQGSTLYVDLDGEAYVIQKTNEAFAPFLTKLRADHTFAWQPSLTQYPSSSPFGASLHFDNEGNIYLIGGFVGTLDFDPGPAVYELTAPATGKLFLAKLNADWELLWARTICTMDALSRSHATVDRDDNLLFGGTFVGQIDFDTGSEPVSLSSTIGFDAFVFKLTPNGDLSWAHAFGGDQYDDTSCVTTDSVGNVLLGGHFGGTVDFDPGDGVFELRYAGAYDGFISKLDSDGNFMWACHPIGGSNDVVFAMATDGLDNIYATGYFSYTTDFEPDPDPAISNLTSQGSYDAFVWKLNSSGKLVWVRGMGGPNADTGDTISVDELGYVYTSGGFSSSVDFDPGAGTYYLDSAPGTQATFVSKLDDNGDLVWAKALKSTVRASPISAALDSAGNYFLTGRFEGTLDADPGSGVREFSSHGADDGFVVEFSGRNDLSAATVNISSDAPLFVNEPIDVELRIPRLCTSFDESDLVTDNAIVCAFSGSGRSFHFKLTPVGQGEFSCVVPAGSFTDSNGLPNSASNTLARMYDSVPPTFSNAVVNPESAEPHQTVSIQFDASEDLESAPELSINGNPATFVDKSGNTYRYEYTVRLRDTDGSTALLVEGLDAAGNVGTSTFTGAITIESASAALPLLPATAFVATIGVLVCFGLKSIRRHSE